MPINSRTACASDFDEAAHKQSRSFIMWAAITAVTAYFFGWMAVIPAIFTVWAAVSGILATANAMRLRHGNYHKSNPNNGAPDGDVRNMVNPLQALMPRGQIAQ
jgi:hypothetical protein